MREGEITRESGSFLESLGVGMNRLILASCSCGWMEGWIGGRRKTPVLKEGWKERRRRDGGVAGKGG